MAKNNSNKKRKKTNPINWKKIGIFGGVVAFLILLVIIIGVATKDKFYECVQYDWYEKVNTQEIKTQDGMKEDYEFYRLFLESDGTFELKYRLKNGTITYTDQGTYKKTKTTLILTYSSPSQELVKVCTYTIEDDKLVRNELVDAPDGTRVRVEQIFELD